MTPQERVFDFEIFKHFFLMLMNLGKFQLYLAKRNVLVDKLHRGAYLHPLNSIHLDK